LTKTLLIIGLVWPEPKSSAAGTRMLQLIDLFKNQNYTILFASAAQESDYSFDLNSIGVLCKNITLNSSSFDDFIKELNPEIVLFDRYVIEEQFGWRVFENCPKALRILDTEDLHCLRIARQNAIKKNIEFQLSDLLSEPVAQREIASILRCDLSLIISDFEMMILKEVFKIDESLIYYLPLFYKVDTIRSISNFDSRKDFVFIGNFLHEPNWDAVKQLKEFIWPLIRKQLPQAKMNIYGAYPSQKVFQLENLSENFIVHGRVEDSTKVIEEAKILLAPLRFGGGLKGKLLESMQLGTPFVTTSIGAEGIYDEVNYDCISDIYQELAQKACLIYQNENIWHKLQKMNKQILKNKFDKNIFISKFYIDIKERISALSLIRKHNFIGNMLMHNSLMSLKYMSKWIEEKNKTV
jgi:glycosyltransferase involved in cell wall biosynthesis